MSNGQRIEYLTCPKCGFTFKSTNPEEIRQLKELKKRGALKCPFCNTTL